MVDTCTCIHTFMRACINTSSTCMHTYTHTSVPSCRFAPHTVVNCLYEFSWTPTMHNAYEAVQWVCVCLVADPQAGISRDQRPKDEYIYIWWEKHTWPYMAFMCMFSFASSNILSLVSATSWPGDIGCCGNWESRGGEGRESSLSFFSCGFLGKCIFASMHIGVGSGHICRKHRKLPLFLISGHGT